MTSRPRFLVVGGFLGAGKTTAIRRLARHLADQGLRVGLITNDQAPNLVDTALLEACGFLTEEIAGGCFCCRFDDLIAATGRLTAGETPDVFIAEAVGSCTDLMATVLQPLRRLHPDRFSVGPLSVVVDPIRARQVLGLDPGDQFSEEVRYIFRKQLEEADIIVVNKADLIDEAGWSELAAAVRAVAPSSSLHLISARGQHHLDSWFASLSGRPVATRPNMELDYDRYAAGEADLGWLNATIDVSADPPIGGDLLLGGLAAALRRRLNEDEAPIAHLKVSLAGADAGFGALSLTRTDETPDITFAFGHPIARGRLTVNLRAQADPERLLSLLRDSTAEVATDRPAIHLDLASAESFRPGRPTPTHRDAG